MGDLILKNLTIRYGGQAVVNDFSLEVQNGEMISLLGPSGAGKTTVLKTVAGLIQPEKGKIIIDGRLVNDLAPEKRNAVMVFQKNPVVSVSQCGPEHCFWFTNAGAQRDEHQTPHRKDLAVDATHRPGPAQNP